MQVIFRFEPTVEIEVWSGNTSVNIFRRVGIEPTEDGRYVQQEHVFSFSKAQARAIASAMMGAAAEL